MKRKERKKKRSYFRALAAVLPVVLTADLVGMYKNTFD